MSYEEGQLAYFKRVATLGERILSVIGGLPTSTDTNQYLELVEKIYDAFTLIHDNVINVTFEVKKAKSLSEAANILQLTRQLGLKDSLRAQNMCNELRQIGYQMRSPYSESLSLDNQEKADWYELSTQLERGEGGAALLYEEKLQELHQLASSELDLISLQKKVVEISNLLVIQKARFESLATRAKAMRNKIL